MTQLVGKSQEMVAVAFRRRSFTRVSNCKALTGKGFDRWSLTRGGRTWRFDRNQKLTSRLNLTPSTVPSSEDFVPSERKSLLIEARNLGTKKVSLVPINGVSIKRVEF